ncbi:MAG: tyrosine recombinase XerC [Gammaproteobacteria bacterium]|nr:tyrosine recombinase XerC [Gammaproteobacteria bacterium]
MNLQEDISQFLHYLMQEKRMSPHTVSNYQRDLKRFYDFCYDASLEEWATVKSSHIRQFIALLHRSGLSARTLQRNLSAIRSFYRFLIRENTVENNPALAVQAPKAEKRLPSTLDIDQISGLLAMSSIDSFIACRDSAIMELFYSSGLRLAELARLDVRDIDIGDQLVYVTGKGDKSRVIPVGRQAISALTDWLLKREQLAFYEQAALFITKQGSRLGMRAIQQRMRYWGKKQGISDRVHPHRLRHAFASHMLEASGDLRAVQELLGHADISTTQIYTHVDFQHLAKVYDNAHPRAKKTKK